MPQFKNIVIRCELYVNEISDGNNFISIATGKPPVIYKGAQVEFQFCLFSKKFNANADAELYDISNVTGLPKLRIRLSSSSGTVLLDESLATVTKDVSTTLATWQDGSKQHFTFYFPETATGITAGTQFIVVYGPDGDVFGTSAITVIDAGTGAEASPAMGDPTYYTKVDTDGKLNDKLDKQLAADQPISFIATNASGQQTRITLQPIWDDQGARLVPIVEPL